MPRSTAKANAGSLPQLVKAGVKSAIPASVKPMLCTLIKEPVTDEHFIHEIKWDGYRIICHVSKGKVRMDSRSGLDYTKKYPPIADALKLLNHNVVLDGEAVVFNQEGKPDFDALQLFNGHTTPIVYCAFDVLWLDGYKLMQLPLLQRKNILQELLQGNEVIKYSEHFDNAAALYNQMLQLDLEGIVSKNKNRPYVPGQRGNAWFKTPTEKRQEFVVGGYTESSRGRSFASILFGAYNGKNLEWIGHAGGGFKEADMPGILKKMQLLQVDQSPFINKVEASGKPHYIKPILVANFKFATWTKSGRIRKPAIFLGWRNDKKATDVIREVPIEDKATEQATPITKKAKSAKPKGPPKAVKPSAGSNWPELLNIAITSRDTFKFDSCEVELTNVERELWQGITKANLIQYYHSVSKYILPHIQNRALSLHVKPYSPAAPGLYIKDMEGHQPACAHIFSTHRKHPKPGKRSVIDYLVCNNEATLMYIVNLGCIDVNPWSSLTTNYLQPTYISIDLDLSDQDFNKAITTSLAAKQFFDENKLKAFPKTSGKTGMHLFIPCIGFSFPQARTLAVHICNQIQLLVPNITTTAVSINQRGDKLFVDPSQNDEADTLASAYSVRPSKQPTVSAPLEWKEVNAKLHPTSFTIQNMLKRIEKKGDLFLHVHDGKIAAANTKQLTKIAAAL